jgi:hypothetical protein
MTTGKPWTDNEIKLICDVYAAMLHFEGINRKFNKAAIRRASLPMLEGRSGGSWEMKCCNISAALNDLGMPWVKGYKPLAGYQRSLKAYANQACTGMYFDYAEVLIQALTSKDKEARA